MLVYILHTHTEKLRALSQICSLGVLAMPYGPHCVHIPVESCPVYVSHRKHILNNFMV